MNAQQLANMLVNGQTYEIRTYRRNPGAWKHEPLFVQHHNHEATVVTPSNFGWAEYDPRQDAYLDNGILSFSAEDYWMDIKISSIDPNHG